MLRRLELMRQESALLDLELMIVMDSVTYRCAALGEKERSWWDFEVVS